MAGIAMGWPGVISVFCRAPTVQPECPRANEQPTNRGDEQRQQNADVHGFNPFRITLAT